MARYERSKAPTMRRTSRAALLFAALLFPAAPVIAGQEVSGKLESIDGYAMSGDPDRIRLSIDEYKKLETIDSDPELQWRLLRAYGNLFSELTCRNRSKEQKEAAEAGYDFAVEVDAAHSANAELVYYYADISGRYYKDHLIEAVFLKIFGGFDPIGNCEKALAMDPNIDYAGPLRCLGVLYLMLPGSRDPEKAVTHLQEAVDRFPKRVANRIWLAKALAKVGRYEDAWAYIKGIQAGDFEIGKDVSSRHWANIYKRQVEHINQENIKDFGQLESEDECGGHMPAGPGDDRTPR